VLPVDAQETGFPFARSIIKAQTKHQHQAGSEPTVRYFISSHPGDEVSPARFAQKVRAHWNIENGSHWQRDKLWREDNHLMRHHRRAHILSTLRQVALHQHSIQGVTQGKARRISHQTQIAVLQIPLALSLLHRPT
jgi:predicted transposase YbfD/YdcC